MISREAIIDALKGVSYPGFTRDIVSFGIVKEIKLSETEIEVILHVNSSDDNIINKLKEAVTAGLKENFSDIGILVNVLQQAPAESSAKAADSKPAFLPMVKHKIAVASGKGGVGKSTVAVNLALALAKKGLRVGLLDVDIYGPSIPMMLGISDNPYSDGSKILPIEKFGLQLMSFGFLIDNSEAVIWRGALVHRAVQQLMTDVDWPELDVMLFDMPPGTGDAQLTLSQSVALDGAVIVSTPQDVALLDAVKGVKMFRQVNVTILGIIENMSYFECPHCKEHTNIFSSGGVKKECEKLETSLLGEIPLDLQIRAGGDKGIPIVEGNPDSAQSRAFMEIADKIKSELG